ncbi:MAG: AzlC family ABC transporter permease [Actinobacteria bacterium]|nr:AzlC family ABC transporter permease [Actinomycetota bacterium]
MRGDPEIRRVVVSSLTLSGAVGVFALSFGVASVGAGASVWQTCALSLFVFTGASQFSAMSVIGAGGSMLAAYGGAVLLAIRNMVYGLALSPSARSLGKSLPHRLLAAQFVIDETTALALAESSPRFRKIAFWTTGIGLFSFWNLGTLIGALAGSAIDPQKFGLDIAFPAAFVAMLRPHLGTKLGRQTAMLGGALCLLSISFVPVGVPILIAATAIVLGVRNGR